MTRSDYKTARPFALVALTLALVLAAPAALAEEHTVDIIELKYKPAKLTIKVGDTVVWTNSDDRDHTVTEEDGAFDSGKISSSEKFEHTFTEAGEYAYHCDSHPRMKGKIIVKE